MSRNPLLLSLALLLSGCASSVATVKNTARAEKEEIRELASARHSIENEFLLLTVFPSVSGGIENVTVKESGLSLLYGGKLLQISSGPLLVRPSASGVLFMEKFWKGSDGIISDMEIRDLSGDSMTLYTPEYGSLNAGLSRQVTLEKDALAIRFLVRVNFRKPPRKGYASPWLNLMPAAGIDWVAAIPAVGGSAVNGLGMKTDFPATGIYRGGWNGPNTFFAPERNWIAVSSPEKKIALALVYEYDRARCTFYSWHGRGGRTIEIILPDLTPDRDLSGQYGYRMLIFPGISDLREIVRDTAVEYRQQGKTLTMRFCSVRRAPARKLELFLTEEKGKAPVALGSRLLPELGPGKVTEVTFDLPDEKPVGVLSGTLDGEKFAILPVIR